MDSDQWELSAFGKSYIVDTSPKCAEYLFEKDGCSSFLINRCLKTSCGPAIAKLMSPLHLRSDMKNTNTPLDGTYLADFGIDITGTVLSTHCPHTIRLRDSDPFGVKLIL